MNTQQMDQLLGIMDHLEDGVYIVDQDYNIVYANAAFIREFGPVGDQKCYEYLCGGKKPCPECEMEQVLAGKVVHVRWESQKTGKVYDSIDMPLGNPDGRKMKIKIIHDLTETEINLRKIHDLSRFPEENPFPVLRLAADGTILYSNTPGMVLVEEWASRVGQKVPEHWRKIAAHTLESGRYHVEEIACGSKLFSVALAPVTDGGYVNLYGRDMTRQKQIEDALRQNEQQIRRKMDIILSPEGDIGELELEDIIDIPAVQQLMLNFYELVQVPTAIIDMAGNVLVSVGWQDICTRFHRVNPQTCAHCLESDLELSAGAYEGEYKLYQCRNHLWDAATPIIIGGKKMGNLFTGQFFFDDQTPDYEAFRRQAAQYHFNEADYMAALQKVPRLNRKTIDRTMEFLHGLAKMISQLSYGNLKLARVIEEQKRAERAQRESEDRFRTIFEANKDGMLITDRHSRKFVMGNEAICRMLGYSRDEIKTLSVEDIHRGDDLPMVLDHFEKLAMGTENTSENIPMKRKDGSLFFADISATPITLSGKPYLVGSIRDVTERTQIQENLEWSARRNELLSETAARLLQSDDPRRLIDILCRQVMEFLDCQTFFNFLVDEPAGRLHLNACTGVSPEEMSRLEWLDFGVAVCGHVARDGAHIVAEDVQNTDDPLTEIIKSYGIQAYCCHPLIVGERLIGTLSFGTRTRTAFTDREIDLMQSIAALMAFAMFRIEAQRAIRENEQRLRLAAEAADFGMYDVDLVSGTVYWSPEFKRIVGIENDTQIPPAGSIPEFLHPDDVERIKKMRETSYDPKGNGEIEYEYRIVRPNGQIRWVWLHGQVVFDKVDGRKKAVRSTGILLDVTDRKLAEEKLKESFDELSLFNRMAVDRELRMIELKKEVNELCRQAHQPERYEMNRVDGLPVSEPSDNQR